jgi:predicted nucleic acid-binding protein
VAKALLRVVTNSTPLIALAQCELFPLLHTLFGQVLMPPAVYREVVSEGDGRVGVEETQGAVTDGWLVVEVLQEPADAIRIQHTFLLGDGESEALALARQQLTDVILLDEARAVRCAREMGLPVLRTVGLLLHAQAQGHLESVKPALDQLRTLGFRLSESVYQAALRQAGESP